MPDTPDDDEAEIVAARIAAIDLNLQEIQSRLRKPQPATWEVISRWKDLARHAMELLGECTDAENEEMARLMTELEILEKLSE